MIHDSWEEEIWDFTGEDEVWVSVSGSVGGGGALEL